MASLWPMITFALVILTVFAIFVAGAESATAKWWKEQYYAEAMASQRLRDKLQEWLDRVEVE